MTESEVEDEVFEVYIDLSNSGTIPQDSGRDIHWNQSIDGGGFSFTDEASARFLHGLLLTVANHLAERISKDGRRAEGVEEFCEFVDDLSEKEQN